MSALRLLANTLDTVIYSVCTLIFSFFYIFFLSIWLPKRSKISISSANIKKNIIQIKWVFSLLTFSWESAQRKDDLMGNDIMKNEITVFMIQFYDTYRWNVNIYVRVGSN